MYIYNMLMITMYKDRITVTDFFSTFAIKEGQL